MNAKRVKKIRRGLRAMDRTPDEIRAYLQSMKKLDIQFKQKEAQAPKFKKGVIPTATANKPSKFKGFRNQKYLANAKKQPMIITNPIRRAFAKAGFASHKTLCQIKEFSFLSRPVMDWELSRIGYGQ